MSRRDVLILAEQLESTTRQADHLFHRIRSELANILPPGVRIEHIGATAVPGCLTKGDLDIVVRVKPTQFEEALSLLSGRYTANTGSVRTSTFAAFTDDTTDPPLGVQLVVIGSEFDIFTWFRDLLRENPELVERYNDLKRRYDKQDMDGYREAKSQFINSVLNSS